MLCIYKKFYNRKSGGNNIFLKQENKNDLRRDEFINKFTSRELDVLSCLFQGKISKQIANYLEIHSRAVDNNIQNIMNKTEIHSRFLLKEYFSDKVESAFFENRFRNINKEFLYNKALFKIGKNQKKEILCKLSCNDMEVKNRIIQDLKKAKILCVERKKDSVKININMPKEDAKLNVKNIEFETDIQSLVFKILSHLIQDFKLLTEVQKDIEKNIFTFKDETIPKKNSSKKNKHKFYVCLLILLFIGSVFTLFSISIFKENLHLRNEILLEEKRVLCRPYIQKNIKNIYFQQNTPIRFAVIFGPPGSGKSLEAKMFLKRESSEIAYELDAENREKLLLGYEKLAILLSNSKLDNKEVENILRIKESSLRERSVIQFVQKKLKSSKKWFLVFDNVEDFKSLESLIPQDSKIWGKGKVLITTKKRRSEISFFVPKKYCLEITSLTQNERFKLFNLVYGKDIKSKSEKEKVNRFLELVQPFPLDIISAAIDASTEVNYEQYLDDLLENKIGQDLKNITGYRFSRYEIIRKSFDEILKMDKNFIPILINLIFFDSQKIPISFLETLYTRNLVLPLLKQMDKKWLIDIDEGCNFLSLHRETQKVLERFLISILSCEYSDCVLSFIKNLNDNAWVYVISGDVFQLRLLMNHLLSLEKKVGTSSLSITRGAIHFQNGEFHNAQLCLEDQLKEGRYKNWASRMYLGATYLELGRFKEAYNLLNSCVDFFDKQKVRGQEIAFSYHWLGKYFLRSGLYEKAINCLSKSNKIYSEINKQTNMTTLYGMSELGQAYTMSGQFLKGEEILKKCLSECRLISYDHITSAQAFMRLGRLYLFMGKYRQAINLLEEGLKLLTDQFSGEQRKIGWTLRQLGEASRQMGDMNSAKKYLNQAHDLYKNFFGENNINTRWIEGSLGVLFLESRKENEASLILEKCMSDFEKNLGTTNIDTIFIRRYLAKSYIQRSRYIEAYKILKDCLGQAEKQYGTDHTEYALILNDICYLKIQEQKPKEAKELAEKALGIFQKVKHQDAFRSFELLGDICKLEKSYGESKKYYKKSIRDLDKHFPSCSVHSKRLRLKTKGV